MLQEYITVLSLIRLLEGQMITWKSQIKGSRRKNDECLCREVKSPTSKWEMSSTQVDAEEQLSHAYKAGNHCLSREN